MNWLPDQPHNGLPPLPPAVELETPAVLKACIPARAALAELKQAGELLPNQGLLINLLPLLEARDSSEIENIVTTTDRLFQFAQEDTYADPATVHQHGGGDMQHHQGRRHGDSPGAGHHPGQPGQR